MIQIDNKGTVYCNRLAQIFTECRHGELIKRWEHCPDCPLLLALQKASVLNGHTP